MKELCHKFGDLGGQWFRSIGLEDATKFLFLFLWMLSSEPSYHLLRGYGGILDSRGVDWVSVTTMLMWVVHYPH